jgi:glycine cleavage system aminomethyltransferase T
MKKECAVLCAVLSVLLLVSAFAGEDNVVRWARIVGVITTLNVDNPVGNISSGTFSWTTRRGIASVNLATGAASWEVDGLVINARSSAAPPGRSPR